VGAVGSAVALRWWYYYFLSGGAMGNWLNVAAFPACSTSACFTELTEDLFSRKAFGTTAFVTWDAMGIVILAVINMAIDGQRYLPAYWTVYVALGLVIPELAYPAFLLHLSTVPSKALPPGATLHYKLYVILGLVLFVPTIVAAWFRVVSTKFSLSAGFHVDMRSNPSVERAFFMVMAFPVIHLAEYLQTSGEETPKRKEQTAWVYTKKFLVWNAYMSNVMAAHAGVLAFKEMDHEIGIPAAPAASAKKSK